MLWTDGYPIASLGELDNDATSVASGEENPIDMAQVANLAYSECSSILRDAISQGGLSSCPGGFDPHMRALFDVGIDRANVSHRYDLMNVSLAKHRQYYSDLMMWYGYTALVHLYRTAYSNVTNDRYQAKILLNDREQRRAWRRITNSGIPMVQLPLSRPGAMFDPFAGSWSSANLSQVDAVGASGGTYYVSVSWVAGGVESALSDAVSRTVAADKAIRVSITGLSAPSGSAASIYQGVTFPTAKATGWNVYAGASASSLQKQNASVIPIGSTVYDFTDDPVASGIVPGTGQRPDVFARVIRLFNRA